MVEYKSLGDMEIFQGVRQDTLRRLEKAGRLVSMKKGTVCYRANELVGNIYILMEGRAIVYNLTRGGSRKIIFVYGSGMLLNDSIVTMGKSTVFCDLVRDSRVFVIPNRSFCLEMAEDFALVQAVMRVQERKLWRTEHQLKNSLGSIYLEKKLAAKLWKLARDFGKPVANMEHAVKIDVDLSITFLADLLGAPRETTSRLCKSLVNRGYITMEKRNVIVNNMDCMAKFYKSLCGKECSCGKEELRGGE